MECIILAGGLGTRLKGVIGAVPKCMAPVLDKPFLGYVLQWLEQQQCSRVVLSLGHLHEVILQWLPTQHFTMTIDYVIETEPLGTGGGIQLAMQQCKSAHVAVLNGDTMFQVSMASLMAFHTQNKAMTTLALKEMTAFERYGVVKTNDKQVITAFEEKKFMEVGTINGGVYIIDRQQFNNLNLPKKFSFEKDYLEAIVGTGQFYGMVQEGYFIDIGIPEDYAKVQVDFKTIFE